MDKLFVHIHKLLTKFLIIMNKLLITVHKIVDSYQQILLIAYECTNFLMAINTKFIRGWECTWMRRIDRWTFLVRIVPTVPLCPMTLWEYNSQRKTYDHIYCGYSVRCTVLLCRVGGGHCGNKVGTLRLKNFQRFFRNFTSGCKFTNRKS